MEVGDELENVTSSAGCFMQFWRNRNNDNIARSTSWAERCTCWRWRKFI